MAGLKRRLLDTSRAAKTLKIGYDDLARQHADLQRDHDAMLSLLIALARESQERALMARALKVKKSTLAVKDGWAISTEVPDGSDYVTIHAIRQLPTAKVAS